MTRSRFDKNRETVGTIYRKAAESNTDKFVECGDLVREMMKSLVDDLNDTIESDPFDGKPFYITVYEKKDLHMKRCILRRLYKSLYRPYPEDDTTVFYVEPKTNKVKFCWCIPHTSEMPDILMNFTLYEKDLVNDVRAYKAMDLDHFGFTTIRHVVNGQEKETLVPKATNNDKWINAPEVALSMYKN